MKICDFTKPELAFLVENCNFTEREQVLFNLRAKNHSLEECAELLNISTATVQRCNSCVKDKIERVKRNEVYNCISSMGVGTSKN